MSLSSATLNAIAFGTESKLCTCLEGWLVSVNDSFVVFLNLNYPGRFYLILDLIVLGDIVFWVSEIDHGTSENCYGEEVLE